MNLSSSVVERGQHNDSFVPNIEKIFPPAFFNILKEPLFVQKQMILQKKGRFGAGKSKGLALSGGNHAYLSQKGIEQKVNFREQRQDAYMHPVPWIHMKGIGILMSEY